MSPLSLTLLIVFEVLVASVVAALLSRDLERIVALRYLRQGRRVRVVKLLLIGMLALLAAGTVTFLAAHGKNRTLETAGAFVLFVAGLGSALSFLLYLFSIFTAVSTLGVALGVASLVVVFGVTGGFEREFKDKVLAVNGHILATGYGSPDVDEAEKEAAEMEARLKDLPGLTGIERFSLSAGEVMIGKIGANLKGVDLAQGATDVKRALVEGNIADLGKPAKCPVPVAIVGETPEPPVDAGRIVLGQELARRLKAKVGACVPLFVPFSATGDLTPPLYRFKVVGIFHLGFNEYDSRLAYVNIEDAKRLAGARQSIFGVEMRFADPIAALSLVPEVEERLGPAFKVIDWRSLNANLFTALTMQKVVISVILLIIIVVAAFNILASLYLIVLTKVREIAILGSMGARAMPVIGIFVVAGAVVGVAGAGLGVGLGLLICGLLQRFGYQLDPKVYLIERLPVALSTVEVMLVPAAAVAICLLATLYPAVKASRLRTVEGLRYD